MIRVPGVAGLRLGFCVPSFFWRWAWRESAFVFATSPTRTRARSEIELPYLKDPEGFSLAVSRTLSLSLCFPAVQACPFPHGMVASKTRKSRSESPRYGGLKNAIFDPLIPTTCSFQPAYRRCKKVVEVQQASKQASNRRFRDFLS